MIRQAVRLFAVVTLVSSGTAHAQLGLPGVGLPPLPPVLDQPVGNTVDTLRRDLRGLRIEKLLRAHPQQLEAGPHGQPIVRGEIGALGVSDAALAAAQQAGFLIARDQQLAGLGLRLIILRVPDGMSTRRALKQLRALDPQGTYDFNYLYLPAGQASPASQAAVGGAPVASPEAGASRARVGLVDGGIDDHHPSLAGVLVHHFGCDGKVVPSDHGTEVASLLAGSLRRTAGSDVELYAADAFCGEGVGGSIGLLALGLDWLARQSVPVINISLVGPSSVLLTGLVHSMVQRGYLLVAAVGNDGPAAPPLFPAAYPGVIGVTAVDQHDRVLLEACRGSQVDFAAPGADLRAAGLNGSWSEVRGTSFAAPLVAGLLAAHDQAVDPMVAQRAVAALTAAAVDLGRRGRDPDYGDGLVGASLRHAAESVKQK